MFLEEQIEETESGTGESVQIPTSDKVYSNGILWTHKLNLLFFFFSSLFVPSILILKI